MAPSTVVVTGATGFIASWLVKLLLERGYTVRGTVRDPNMYIPDFTAEVRLTRGRGNSDKAQHIRELPGADERLELFEADLLVPGSFDKVVEGADGVFHTASPFFQDKITDPQVQLIDPAVKGTLNVLNSCAKAGTKRIVLTSSVAAVSYLRDRADNVVIDESVWSDAEYCRETKQWYVLSKILAEKAAWDFAKEKDLDLVVVNPSGVSGPFLQSSPSSSTAILLHFLSGTAKTYPNIVNGWVGVIDVALAHVLVFENPDATGRYICSNCVLRASDFIAILTKLYPSYPIPTKCADETTPRPPYYTLNTQKLQNLGLSYQPLEEVIQETVDCFKNRKLLE